MTGDSHPTEQGAGKPLEAPQSREAPLVGTERRPGGEFGPQAATDGFDGPEIHHWDAAKTAEVARILAEHPPRHVGWITSNADQPETPMPEPTPAEHCGDARKHPAHKAMRGRRVFQCCGTVAQPSPADVRDQIAAAIRDAACDGDCGKTEDECARERIQPFAWHHGKLTVVEGSPEQFADAVLRVPAIAEAVGAAARVRDACDQLTRAALNADGVPLTPRDEGTVRAADRILAALDPQEQP